IEVGVGCVHDEPAGLRRVDRSGIGRIRDERRELDTSIIGTGVRLEAQKGVGDGVEITPEVRSRRVGDRDNQIVRDKGASVDLLECSKESAGAANAKRGGASDADGLVPTRQRGRQCNKTGLIDRARAARRGKREQFVTSYRDSTDRSVAMS